MSEAHEAMKSRVLQDACRFALTYLKGLLPTAEVGYLAEYLALYAEARKAVDC